MDYWNWWIEWNGQRSWSDGRYLTDVFTEEAIDFVKRHQSEPFLLVLTYNAPHSPLHAPEDLIASYVDRGERREVAATYAMIEAMDAGIGRLLETLEDLSLSDGTMVMFTSDNGPALRLRDDQVPKGWSTDTLRPNAGFRAGKGSVYKGGIRVPMIVNWPDGLEGGREVTDMIHFTDWLPTLVGAADVACPATRSLDGVDVMGSLTGETAPDGPERFWQLSGSVPVYTSNAAMRDGKWKLVRPALFFEPVDDDARRAVRRGIRPSRIRRSRDPRAGANVSHVVGAGVLVRGGRSGATQDQSRILLR